MALISMSALSIRALSTLTTLTYQKFSVLRGTSALLGPVPLKLCVHPWPSPYSKWPSWGSGGKDIGPAQARLETLVHRRLWRGRVFSSCPSPFRPWGML